MQYNLIFCNGILSSSPYTKSVCVIFFTPGMNMKKNSFYSIASVEPPNFAAIIHNRQY